jgi:membrane-bound serine protease (ClpP class)
VQPVRRNAVEKFFDFVADPQITFILLSLGGILVIIELLNPGMILPGSLGVIALAMAFLGLGNLPANWVGVALILLGLALFYGELLAPGLGVLGLSGGVSFIVGAFLLFAQFDAPAIPAPSLQVSVWVIVVIGVIMASFVVLSFNFMRESKRLNFRSTVGTLIGDVGFATTALEPKGTVKIASELWTAESESGDSIPSGEEVVVSDIEGLTLKVVRSNEIEK